MATGCANAQPGNEGRNKETSMKMLLAGASAIAVAVLAVSGFGSGAKAAPAQKSEYCSMAFASNNGYAARESWADYYHCWDSSAPSARPAPASHVNSGPPKSEFCAMAPASNNGYAARESWADYYHCWN
jgi:hypothetical protein